MLVIPPELTYPLTRETHDYQPSWPRAELFLGEEHRTIWDRTKDLPGWQSTEDSQKLYEIAYYCGSVILEIGMYGGRSAAVELRGALAGAAARDGLPAPRYYGLDVSLGAVQRTLETLKGEGLAEHALLYHGDLRRFLRDIPIVPTMVFVDGDHLYPGVWADLNTLRGVLPAGVPVYCHDYFLHPEGVRRAVDEAVERGWFDLMGRFAGAVLLRARGTAPAARRDERWSGARGLSHERFAKVRTALLTRYEKRLIAKGRPPAAQWTPAADLTRGARAELLSVSDRRSSSGRSGWPHVNPEPPLPPTMPDGRPWPRITVVTPSYNQGRYIEETILSVRNQGYPDVEHIVIDGGSKDETVSVVEKYLDGIAHFVSEKDKGQSDAINKGFARATGEIYTWINSDDMLAPGALAAAALAFDTSGADLVNGICRVYKEGRLQHQCISSVDTEQTLPLWDLLDIENCWMKGEFWYQPDVMFTRALWERAGAHVNVGWYYSMDYELWVRFAEVGARVHVIGRPLCWFRAHEEQKTQEKASGNGEKAPAKAQEEKGFWVELPKVREAWCAAHGVAWTPREHAPVKPRLKVCFFNDLGFQQGAGLGHRRLADSLAAAGHEISVVALTEKVSPEKPPRFLADEVVEKIAGHDPDLVVVGNLHGAGAEPAVLEAIARRFETAVVLHDLWPLTGRCTYTGGCDSYLKGCTGGCTCPQGYPRLSPERVADAWADKRRILTGSPRLSLLGNSRWMLGQARRALADVEEHERPGMDWVRFGFDLETFRPRDKMDARDALGLPRDRFIIMSSASSLADERKGLAHLAQALEFLDLPDTLVTSVGWFRSGEAPPIPGMRALGYVDDPARLALIYSAADLFVGPSLEEAFGQVFVEAALCGTPSVGYKVGGVPEAIREGVSGRIAQAVTPMALADAIDEMYRCGSRREQMGRWGRIWAENEWSPAAAMHQFHTALQRTGAAARIGLSRKINLTHATTVPEPEYLVPEGPGYRALWGMAGWEGPNAARDLGRYRWTVGPTCAFEVKAERGGPARVVLGCRSWEQGQRVRLVHKSRVIAECPVEPTPDSDRMLAFDVDLEPGVNTFELHHWKWKVGTEKGGALMLTSVNVVPVG